MRDDVAEPVRTPDVSVVVPVFNSEKTLPQLVGRVADVLSRCTTRFEVLLVNDGSTDDSWAGIAKLARDRPFVRGIELMRNYGQHSALLAGIRAATGTIIVTMDDDLQNPPEEIPKLLAALTGGYDVVYGTPIAEQQPAWRILASRVTKLALQGVMGAETARKVSAFRAFRAEVRKAFADYESPFVCIDVLLSWGTTRFAAVAVRHDARTVGASAYTVRRLIAHAVNMVTGFSVWPLQLASMVGFATTLFGVGVFVYVVGRYVLQGGSVPGFPFLASAVAIFAGAQLFALGIIGEYLARMHFRMMNRPAYVVRSVEGGSVRDGR